MYHSDMKPSTLILLPLMLIISALSFTACGDSNKQVNTAQELQKSVEQYAFAALSPASRDSGTHFAETSCVQAEANTFSCKTTLVAFDRESTSKRVQRLTVTVGADKCWESSNKLHTWVEGNDFVPLNGCIGKQPVTYIPGRVG